MDVPTWVMSLIGVLLGAILAGVLKLAFDVGGVKEVVKFCDLKEMKTNVDRLVYRQELQDHRAAADAHSPHTPEVDGYIERLMRGELDADGLRAAIAVFEENMKTERNGTKWLNKGLLLDRAKAELKEKTAHD
jgi:hypothetical protein